MTSANRQYFCKILFFPLLIFIVAYLLMSCSPGENKSDGTDIVAATNAAKVEPAVTEVPPDAHDEIPDITGYWNGMLQEEYRIRLWGPEPDEIEGLPLNPKGIKAQEDFDPDYYYKPENQCRNHGGGYVMRGPFARHFIYDEEDENILYIHIELEAQTRTIYLDGRPPPSEEHTSLGHSVGEWENGILTVITTHMTPYFHRRNGVPYSEDAHMTEYFIMHDDEYLTLITKIIDPEYLYEPLVRSLTYKKLPASYEKQFYFQYDCEVIEWEGGNPAGGIKQAD